jgi:hypothetical protein
MIPHLSNIAYVWRVSEQGYCGIGLLSVNSNQSKKSAGKIDVIQSENV